VSAPVVRSPDHVFPGWLTPTNRKWSRVRIPLEGAERLHIAWGSKLELLSVIVAWDPGTGWHLSISHPERSPTWNEIRDARYELLPDACTMGLLLPPRAEYVNLHPHCFHLHQVQP